MRVPNVTRRVAAAVVAVVAAGLAIVASPAGADPAEDRMDRLFDELAQAQQAYLSAQATLDASVVRQRELEATLKTADANLASQRAVVGALARGAYIAAGATTVSSILSNGSAAELLDMITISDALRMQRANQVRALLDALQEAKDLRAAIDAEIAAQEKALREMADRKQEAENALWRVGAGAATPGFTSKATAIADPAPRNADGTWSAQSRTVWEPNTSNYITPRMAHARDEAREAGFRYWTSCYYGGGNGQHPLGRACDFAVESCRFCGDATGAAKQYGTDLAAFFVFNAQRLGVLYVIWYRQIWLPSSGWRSYDGCCTSSQKHTNHVHVSVY